MSSRRTLSGSTPGKDFRSRRSRRRSRDGWARRRRHATMSLLRRRGWAELCAPGLDRPHPLHQAGPGPRLELAVAGRRLAAGRLEILEPGVRLLDQQQFLGLALPRHHQVLLVVHGPDRRTGIGRHPAVAGTLVDEGICRRFSSTPTTSARPPMHLAWTLRARPLKELLLARVPSTEERIRPRGC